MKHQHRLPLVLNSQTRANRRPGILMIAFCVAVATAAVGCAKPAATPVGPSSAKQLGPAMTALKAQATRLGAPSISGTVLSFGTTKINDDFTIVDGVAREFGCTATLFAAQGSAFVRISTNVIKDGKRAVGTELDPNGPVIGFVREGKSFTGVVDILGEKYDTIYEPILDATGAVLGAYYVGFKVSG